MRNRRKNEELALTIKKDKGLLRNKKANEKQLKSKKK
jgi:hypothetical protein